MEEQEKEHLESHVNEDVIRADIEKESESVQEMDDDSNFSVSPLSSSISDEDCLSEEEDYLAIGPAEKNSEEDKSLNPLSRLALGVQRRCSNPADLVKTVGSGIENSTIQTSEKPNDRNSKDPSSGNKRESRTIRSVSLIEFSAKPKSCADPMDSILAVPASTLENSNVENGPSHNISSKSNPILNKTLKDNKIENSGSKIEKNINATVGTQRTDSTNSTNKKRRKGGGSRIGKNINTLINRSQGKLPKKEVRIDQSAAEKQNPPKTSNSNSFFAIHLQYYNKWSSSAQSLNKLVENGTSGAIQSYVLDNRRGKVKGRLLDMRDKRRASESKLKIHASNGVHRDTNTMVSIPTAINDIAVPRWQSDLPPETRSNTILVICDTCNRAASLLDEYRDEWNPEQLLINESQNEDEWISLINESITIWSHSLFGVSVLLCDEKSSLLVDEIVDNLSKVVVSWIKQYKNVNQIVSQIESSLTHLRKGLEKWSEEDVDNESASNYSVTSKYNNDNNLVVSNVNRFKKNSGLVNESLSLDGLCEIALLWMLKLETKFMDIVGEMKLVQNKLKAENIIKNESRWKELSSSVNGLVITDKLLKNFGGRLVFRKEHDMGGIVEDVKSLFMAVFYVLSKPDSIKLSCKEPNNRLQPEDPKDLQRIEKDENMDHTNYEDRQDSASTKTGERNDSSNMLASGVEKYQNQRQASPMREIFPAVNPTEKPSDIEIETSPQEQDFEFQIQMLPVPSRPAPAPPVSAKQTEMVSLGTESEDNHPQFSNQFSSLLESLSLPINGLPESNESKQHSKLTTDPLLIKWMVDHHVPHLLSLLGSKYSVDQVMAMRLSELMEIPGMKLEQANLLLQGIQSTPVTSDGRKVICSTMVIKKGEIVKSWKQRMLVLCSDMTLFYYKGTEMKSPIGSIDLSHANTLKKVDGSRKNVLHIVTPNRVYQISFASFVERDEWYNLLMDVVSYRYRIRRGSMR